jgi:hypothetical protein
MRSRPGDNGISEDDGGEKPFGEAKGRLTNAAVLMTRRKMVTEGKEGEAAPQGRKSLKASSRSPPLSRPLRTAGDVATTQALRSIGSYNGHHRRTELPGRSTYIGPVHSRGSNGQAGSSLAGGDRVEGIGPLNCIAGLNQGVCWLQPMKSRT